MFSQNMMSNKPAGCAPKYKITKIQKEIMNSSGVQIAKSDFSSDKVKSAVNNWFINEHFHKI